MSDLVLGCDLSTKAVALALTDGTTDHVILGQAPGPQRYGDAHRQCEIFTRQMVSGKSVMAAFIETPAGRVHPSLAAMYGVVQSAMWLALERVYERPVPIFTVLPSEWKCAAGLGGGASKEQIMEFAQAIASPRTQDEADALLIAHGGAAMMFQPEAA